MATVPIKRVPHIVFDDDVRRWIVTLRAENPLPSTNWVHGALGQRMLRGAYGTVPVGELSRRALGVNAFMLHARRAGASLIQFLPVTEFGVGRGTAYAYNGGYYVLHIYASGEAQSTAEALGGLLILRFVQGKAAPSVRLLQLGTNNATGGHFVRVFQIGEKDDAVREFTLLSAFDEAVIGHPVGVPIHSHTASPGRSAADALGFMLQLALGLSAKTPKATMFNAFRLHARAGIAISNFFTAALYGSAAAVLAPEAVLTSLGLIALARVLAEIGIDSEPGRRAMREMRARGDENLIVHILLLLSNVYGTRGISNEERALLPSLARSGGRPNPRSFARFHATLISGIRPRNGDVAADDDDDADEQRAKRSRGATAPELPFDLVDQIIIDRIRDFIGPHAMRGLMLANRKLARKSRIFTDPEIMRVNFSQLFPLIGRLFGTQVSSMWSTWVIEDEVSTVTRLTQQLRGEVQQHDARVERVLERMEQRDDESAEQFSERRRMFIDSAFSLQLRRRSLLVRIDPLLRTESLDASRSAELVRRWQLYTGLVERALTNPALRRLLPRDIGGTAAVDAPKLVDGDVLARRLVFDTEHRATWTMDNRALIRPVDMWDTFYEGDFGPQGASPAVLRGLYYVTEWADQAPLEYRLRDEWINPTPPPLYNQSVPRLLNNPPSAADELRFDSTGSDLNEEFAQSLVRKSRAAPRYTPMLQLWDAERKTVEVRQMVNVEENDVAAALSGGLRVAGGGLWTVVDEQATLATWQAAAKRRQFTYAAADRAAFLGMMQHAAGVLDALPNTDAMLLIYAEEVEHEMEMHQLHQDYEPAQQPMIDRWVHFGLSLPVSAVVLYEDVGNVTAEQQREIDFTAVWMDEANGIFARVWTRATRRYLQAVTANSEVFRSAILPALQAAAAGLFDENDPEQKHASELELAWLRYLYVIAGVRQLLVGSSIYNPVSDDGSLIAANHYLAAQGMPVYSRWRIDAEANLTVLARAVRSAPLRRLIRPADADQQEALRKDAILVLAELAAQLSDSAEALVSLVATLETLAEVATAFEEQPTVPATASLFSIDAPNFTAAAESFMVHVSEINTMRAQLERGEPMGLQRADTLIRIRDALMRTLIANVEDRSGVLAIDAAVGDVTTNLFSLARRAQHAHGPRGAEFERQLLSVAETLPSVNLHAVMASVTKVLIALERLRTQSYAAVVDTLAEQIAARSDATAQKLATDLAPDTVAEMIWSLEPRIRALHANLLRGYRNYQLLLLDAEVLQGKFQSGFLWFSRVTATNPNRSPAVERDYHALVLAYDEMANEYHRHVRDELRRISKLSQSQQPLSLVVLELVKEERALMIEQTATTSTK